ncbi:hypothetical protein [Umezawaea sp. Da 62-37]|uniref:hypothetical protein n=1 Tax=Umezawaea sp. Da 62-37 TaxID=3075927 RepID=UPI0028F717D9|nr:hypothetical protein [Umezawaea sp. Da 62-37]WNV91205.1 hypothetical protein RM788_23900 [Umezawaea sp. Da 62-37]
MSLHAFVDESRRNDRYLLVVAIIDPGDLAELRKLLRDLLLPGQKEVHFKKEEPGRRKIILSRLVRFGPVVHVYQCSCAGGEERARQKCLVALVLDLVALGVIRLVLDSREVRDHHDKQTIKAVLGKPSAESPFIYEHVVSTQEQLLWIADVVGWCYGAGGEWRRRAMPLVAREVDLDTWSG